MKQKILCIGIVLSLFITLVGSIEPEVKGQTQELSLERTKTDYIITTDYYKAYIPMNRGIVKHLYINKNGSWVGDLVYQKPDSYGLGFLEGSGLNEFSNNAFGLQQGNISITILSNTTSVVKIRASTTTYGMYFSEDWTFWADVPYFMSEAVTEEQMSKRFVNQDQFAWMINNTWKTASYGTNGYGDVVNITSENLYPIFSPISDTYSWVNWQFVDKGVSLGLVFVYSNDPWAVYGESGDWNFEYQVNFYGSGGTAYTISTQGVKRELTTIYYTSNSLTNDNIKMFARTGYLFATSENLNNPNYRGNRVLSNLSRQNPGVGTAILNSPYFILRQNSQWSNHDVLGPQWITEISPPLYTYPQNAIFNYHLFPVLYYSLGYNNGTRDFEYGNITGAAEIDNGVWMYAKSPNNKLAYNTTFQTWSDSDKLRVTGSVSNASLLTSVKQIYVDLKTTKAQSIDAITASPSYALVRSGVSNGQNWNVYQGRLMFYSSGHHLPILRVSNPDSMSGTYDVFARVKGSNEANLTYHYSWDNVTFNSFTAYSSDFHSKDEPYDAYLGKRVLSGNTLLYLKDNDTVTYWHAWNYFKLYNIKQLSPVTYDVQFPDQIYGRMGTSIEIQHPTENIKSSLGIVRIYLYNETKAHELTSFRFNFNITLWNHKGWISSPQDITPLHTMESLVYSSHKLTGTSFPIYFYDRSPGSKITRANITDGNLFLVISAASGTASELKILTPFTPMEVYGAAYWNYDSETNILTIGNTHSSESETIKITFARSLTLTSTSSTTSTETKSVTSTSSTTSTETKSVTSTSSTTSIETISIASLWDINFAVLAFIGVVFIVTVVWFLDRRKKDS